MRFITPQVHRILDFVTVVAFALSPTLVPLTGLSATLAYALAVVHLLLTFATQFPGAAERPLPFKVHGVIETLVGPTLMFFPLAAGWSGRARAFYLIAGSVILIVSLVSRYQKAAPTSGSAAA